MLSSQLQTCRVNLASSSPWKHRAPRPGRAGFRPSGSRDAACSLDQSVFHAQRRSQIGKSLFDGKPRTNRTTYMKIIENPLPYTMHPFMQSEQISEAGRISTTRLRCWLQVLHQRFELDWIQELAGILHARSLKDLVSKSWPNVRLGLSLLCSHIFQESTSPFGRINQI